MTLPPAALAFFELGIIALLVFGATAGTLYQRHKEKKAKEAETKAAGTDAGTGSAGQPAEPPRTYGRTTRRFPPPTAGKR